MVIRYDLINSLRVCPLGFMAGKRSYLSDTNSLFIAKIPRELSAATRRPRNSFLLAYFFFFAKEEVSAYITARTCLF